VVVEPWLGAMEKRQTVGEELYDAREMKGEGEK
jgi:hypothetical protein